MKIRKYFSLIELIVVIVILGILAAIVIPNVNNIKRDAEITAIYSNIKNLQTAVDMYSLENHNKLPTTSEPIFGSPESLDFLKIIPDYVRSNPEIDNIKYWVDDNGLVWASTIDAPKNIFYNNNHLEWDGDINSDFFSIYKQKEKELKGSLNSNAFELVKVVPSEGIKMTIELPKLESGKEYFVSATDTYGLETPATNSNYDGYVTPKPIENWKWFGLPEEAFDKDDSTLFYPVSGKTYEVTWTPELDEKVVRIKAKGGIRYAGFMDPKPIKFDFVNNKGDILNSISFGMSLETKTTVIPRGTAKILVKTPTGFDDSPEIYSVEDVPDKEETKPISNLSIEEGETQVQFKWNNPNADDFDRVDIYRNENKVGYSTNGSYIDTSLFSNTNYEYKFIAYDKTGNPSKVVTQSIRTKKSLYELFGLPAEAFDKDDNTYFEIPTAKEYTITWDSNLEYKTLKIKARGGGRSAGYLQHKLIYFDVLDDTDTVLTSISFNHSISTKTLLIPEGASKLKIRTNAGFDSNKVPYVYTVEVIPE